MSTSDPQPGPAVEGIDQPAGRSASTESLGRQVRRGAAWAIAANLTMRVASIGVTALLARLLSKSDFGVFAIALSVYLVIACLADLGIASAVARSVEEPEEIAPTVATVSIVVGTAAGLLMAVLAPAFASLLGQPAAAGPIRILAICVPLTGLFAVPGAQLVREFRQDRIFLSTIVSFLVSNPLLVVLALQGGGADSFAWSRVLGQLVGGVVFWFSTSRRYVPGWRRDQVRALLSFGLPLSLANLVNYTLLNADYMILSRLTTTDEVGIYVIAFNVASWSTAILGSVLNSVVVPAFGRVGTDAVRLRGAIVRACRVVALVSLPVGALSIGLADPIVRTLFGAKWAEAVPVLEVLAVYGVVYGFSLLFANVLVARGQTLQLLLIQLGWVIVLVTTMVAGMHLWGLVGAAWAHVVSICLVALPGYVWVVARATRSSAAALLSTILLPLGAAILAGAIAWLTSLTVSPSWLRLAAGGLAGGVVYVVVARPALVPLLPDARISGWLPSRWRRPQLGRLP